MSAGQTLFTARLGPQRSILSGLLTSLSLFISMLV
jgi:hypothetical protein